MLTGLRRIFWRCDAVARTWFVAVRHRVRPADITRAAHVINTATDEEIASGRESARAAMAAAHRSTRGSLPPS
jgi:hypothetical protein